MPSESNCLEYSEKNSNIKYDAKPAIVAKQFRGYVQIQVDCNSKTQVQIPLGDIFMLKILTKKEL